MIRQFEYLNNIVEQYHRIIRSLISNGLVSKIFESAKGTLTGIEVMHMLRKNQVLRLGTSMFRSFCK